MAGYLIKNDVSFDFYHIENGSFTDGYQEVTPAEKSRFKELIEIYEGSYNDNWYGKTRKKMIDSYFRKTGLASKAIALESTSLGIMPIILPDINAKHTKRMCYGHRIKTMRAFLSPIS